MRVHVGLSKFRGSARVRVSSRAAGPAHPRTSCAAASSVPPLFHFCYDQRSAWTRLSQLSGEKAAPSSVPGREGHRSEGCGEHGAPPSSPRETFGRAACRPRRPGPDSCSKEQRQFGAGESSSILTRPPALVCLIAPRSLRAQPAPLTPRIDPCGPIEPRRERRAEEEGVGLGSLGHRAVRSQLRATRASPTRTETPVFCAQQLLVTHASAARECGLAKRVGRQAGSWHESRRESNAASSQPLCRSGRHAPSSTGACGCSAARNGDGAAGGEHPPLCNYGPRSPRAAR